MTYDRTSLYVSWGGTIGSSGEDIWQCGLHFAVPGAPADLVVQPDANKLGDLLDGPLTDFHTAASSWIAPGCFLSWAKAATLNHDGHYGADATSRTTTPKAGGSTAPARGGPQVSGVITLWSEHVLGQANFGRIYYPWWEGQVQDNGHVVFTVQGAFLSNAQTMLIAANTWAQTFWAGARVCIMSKVGSGTTKRAAEVRVGDVKDTQQRRRRQLREAYSTGSIDA